MIFFKRTGHKCRHNEAETDGKVREAVMKRSGEAQAQHKEVVRQQGRTDWKPTDQRQLKSAVCRLVNSERRKTIQEKVSVEV